MTADQGKELIARLIESPTSQVLVSEELYLGLRSALEHVGARVYGREVVSLCPRSSRPSHPKIARAELGATPYSLMHQLALFDQIVDVVVRDLHPRCPSCGELALRPMGLIDRAIPREGFIVASIGGDGEDLSLKERCELLGVERAIVEGRLTRIDQLRDEDGESVLALVVASQLSALEEEIDRWFGRGGGELNIYHYEDRSSQGISIGTISRSWRCPSCLSALEVPSREQLANLLPCKRCRGAGWILSEGRFLACRDCEGFGSLDPARNFLFRGKPLSSVATISSRELLVKIRDNGSTGAHRALSQKLEVVCHGGLGEYPLGASVEMLSHGEKVIVSGVVAALSKLSDLWLVVDGASLAVQHPEEIPVTLRALMKVVTPEGRDFKPVRRSLSERPVLELRAVDRGPLCIQSVSFPIGALSCIEGSVGSGKSLLLATIAERFSKRNKLAHVCSFPGLKRCHQVVGSEQGHEFIMDLMGLSDELAREIMRTRAAKEAGLEMKDALLGSSTYRCSECLGDEMILQGSACSRCGGAIFEGRIANLPLLGSSVGEVMTMPLRDLVNCAWGESFGLAVIERLIQHGMGHLRLSSSVHALAPSDARFLAVEAGVCRVLLSAPRGSAESQRSCGELVLIDGPRITTNYQGSALLKSIDELLSHGATVLYADMPQGVCGIEEFKVCLKTSVPAECHEERQHFIDTRYARVMRCSVP